MLDKATPGGLLDVLVRVVLHAPSAQDILGHTYGIRCTFAVAGREDALTSWALPQTCRAVAQLGFW
jgi:hypothetical protein